MLHPYQQISYFNLLDEQYRYCTAQLTESHRVLAQHYRRLAELELTLERRHETKMPRLVKKRLQWSRSRTKKNIRDLERHQIYIHEYLRQCDELIHTYHRTTLRPLVGSWAGHPPPLPYAVNPYTMVPNLWSTVTDEIEQPPQYWDLSMLRERRRSTASVPSADSGFYEPPTLVPFATPQAGQPRRSTFQSADDSVAELGTSASPTKVGAELYSMGRRRFSENAIQLIESRLASPKTHHRFRSVEQISVFDRIGSDSDAIGTDSEAEPEPRR